MESKLHNEYAGSRPIPRYCLLVQESSSDMIKAALSIGALGYVIKAHAASELLAAVETVCGGGQYVSNGNDYRATQQ